MAAAAPAVRAPKPARVLRGVVNVGLVGGAVALYLSAVGMIQKFDERSVISGVITLGRLLVLLTALLAGLVAARNIGRAAREEPSSAARVRAGVLAGAMSGLLPGLLVLLMSAVNVRNIFVSLSPALREILSFGQGPVAGAVILVLVGAVLGAIGAAVLLVPSRFRRPLLIGVATTLLVSLAEPLILASLRELDLETTWLYARRGGMTISGAVLVLALSTAITVAWPRWAALLGGSTDSERPAGNPQPEITRREQAAFGLGIAAAAYALALTVLFFADVDLSSALLLTGLALAVAAVIGGVVIGRATGSRRALVGLIGGASALYLVLPLIVGTFLSNVLNLVGLYVLLGLGLNIVVGYAGLLDLGYVAFFAVGAYATGVFTSNQSFLVLEAGGPPIAPEPFMNFWVALPLVVVLAVVAGVLIGAPVLRLRGDYLAIVTLGFGEIVRILARSDWLRPWLGGSQGIKRIAQAPPEFAEFRDPQHLYYLLLVFILLAVYISMGLVGSRVGRAWAAMREDESVAEAMGISVIKYKLLAFAMGAGIGCLGGAFFAEMIGVVTPESFSILVSINALAVLVLGGMGSMPGVVVGSLALVGLPEMLREFAEFRLLIYGAILVAIMVLKPEGLLPEVRRRRELHEVELPAEQAFAAEAAAPVVVSGGTDRSEP